MHQRLVNYLRLLGFSVCTFALAACVRLAPPHSFSQGPEPRLAEPPSAAEMALAAFAVRIDEQQIAQMEIGLTALSGEIANLRKALDVLGPLPDHPFLFIPVDPSELKASAAKTVTDFHAGGLGAFSSLAPAAANWDARRLKAGYEAPAHNIRLDVALAEDAAVNALCVELSAISGPCRVAAPIRAA